MNRLRDLEGEGDDPLFQRGVEMLRKTPPTAAPADAKRRVWFAIRGATAPVSKPTPARGFRTLIFRLAVACVVALVAGTAGAVIARRWLVPPRPVATPAAPRPAAPPRLAPASPVRSSDLAALAPDEVPPPKAPGRSAPRKPASPAPVAASVAAARERTEVLDALVALRREHDPIRAGALLTRYLSAHPRGALREEALALAIEAADARGDRAAGVKLAQAYQDEFPAGRFLAFARSHTDGRAGESKH